MMYMSGNSLQIFSIMMTVMLFMNPIKALSAVGSTFSRFDNERTHARLWPVKLAFIALQLATIALGIWKVNGMGLLPYAALEIGAVELCADADADADADAFSFFLITGLRARTGLPGKGNGNPWNIRLPSSRVSPSEACASPGGLQPLEMMRLPFPSCTVHASVVFLGE